MHITGPVDIKSLEVVSAEKPKINSDDPIEFLQQLLQEHTDKSKMYLTFNNDTLS
jgi:hypothetical protein